MIFYTPLNGQNNLPRKDWSIMEKHNWFGLLGILAIICLPLLILKDTIYDIFCGD